MHQPYQPTGLYRIHATQQPTLTLTLNPTINPDPNPTTDLNRPTILNPNLALLFHRNYAICNCK